MNAGLLKFSQLGGTPRSIALVRALPGLGDFLCLVPALRALRFAFPAAQITLVGLPVTQALVQRFHTYLTDWLPFPGFPGIPELPFSPVQFSAGLAELQQRRFDLALQLHGSGVHMNGFIRQLGAQITAGCFPGDGVCPDPLWFLPYPDQDSEIWRCLKLLAFLDIPLQGDHLEFPLSSSERQTGRALVAGLNPYICIHPGASTGEKCWQPHHFAAVADALAAQGWAIVLTGSAAEAQLTATVAARMQAKALDLAGKTELGELAAVLQQSHLLICNDTGVSHLAAALKLNSVVVFSNTDPQRWAPLNRNRHRVVGGTSEFDCYPTPGRVLELALDLLHQELVYAYR
jgi:ADP-heptose:LPS heptosyltransferase